MATTDTASAYHASNPHFQKMISTTLPRSIEVLENCGVPFCIAGGLSAWFHGGPETAHDLDFLIRPQDVERVAQAFIEASFEITVPSSDWLIKAWDGKPDKSKSILIDLIYAPIGVPVNDALFARCERMRALGINALILPPTELMIMKLLAIREQHLNYNAVMTLARCLREQIDWKELESATSDSPYAAAFFYLTGLLGINSVSAKALNYSRYERERTEQAGLAKDARKRLRGEIRHS